MKILAVVLIVFVVAAQIVTAEEPVIKGDPAIAQEVTTAMGRLSGLKTYRMKMVPPAGTRGADQMTMVMERVNPDRFRSIMDMQGMMTLEMVGVGQELRRRITLRGEAARANEQQQQQMINQFMGGGVFGFLGLIFNPVGTLINMATAAVMQKMTERVTNQFKSGVWVCVNTTAQGSSTASSASAKSEITVERAGEGAIDGARTQNYNMTIVAQESGRTTTTKVRLYVLADQKLPRRMEGLDANGSAQGGMDFSDFDAAITIDLPACQ